MISSEKIIGLLVLIVFCVVVEIKRNDKRDDDFIINSNNKYEIITDSRWKTMMNDGGSNYSIYYQIDLDNNLVMKKEENYHANLGGTSQTEIKVFYT